MYTRSDRLLILAGTDVKSTSDGKENANQIEVRENIYSFIYLYLTFTFIE